MKLPHIPAGYFGIAILTPIFAGLASFGAVSWLAFFRTLLFFGCIVLFLPVANRLLQSDRKYKTLLVLSGAFVAGVIACALAFPLATSIITRTCPVHYLLSGGVYLTLFYGVYRLYVRYRFHWSYLFIYLTLSGMAGYIFHCLPLFYSLEMFGTVVLASILNALVMAFFLTVLFTRLNPHPIPPSASKNGFISSCIRIICCVFFGFGGYVSIIANGMLSAEKERIFMIAHFSDSSVIRTLSGQLESHVSGLEFIPGQTPKKTVLREEKNDSSSPDGLITIQREKNNRAGAVFLYKGKKIYTAESVYERGFWDRNRYVFPVSDSVWNELTFHGNAPPTVHSFKAQGADIVPGTDAVFYCKDNEFFRKEGGSEPKKIYSAKPFFSRFSTQYHPVATTYSPGFKHIFYVCRRHQFLALPTRILFVFESGTDKVYIYDHFGSYNDNSPMQWREKK